MKYVSALCVSTHGAISYSVSLRAFSSASLETVYESAPFSCLWKAHSPNKGHGREDEMFRHNANMKCCATCEYWMGERQLSRVNVTTMQVLHDGTSADCEVIKNGKHSGTQNASSCRNYKRWTHLS